MRLGAVSFAALVGGRPKLEFNKPILRDGKLLASGRMVVEFKPDLFNCREHSPTGLRIEVPFCDATDEDDAVQQASAELELIGAEISRMAAALLRKSTPEKS